MSTLSYAPEQNAKTSLRPSRQAIKRAALALALALGVAAAADFGHHYLTTGRYLETTDDAYVKADSTIIAPKVSGYIAQVLVGDNEPVKAGQLLAKIDDRDFRAALDQAGADVAASDAAVRNLDAQIALQQPIIEQGTADVAAAEANLKFAQEEQARYDGLMKTGSGTVQRAQQTDAALRAADRAIAARQVGPARGRAQGRRALHRARQGSRAARPRPRGRAAGGIESLLHRHHRAGRRHRRRALAPGRAVRAGRHAADGGRAARCRLHRRQFQGDPAHPCAQRPAGRADHRQLPRHQTARPCRQPVAGQRPGVRAAAARQRHRQLHQDRAAHAGEDRARRPQPDRPAASRHVGRADHQHQIGGDRRTRKQEAPRIARPSLAVE